MKFVSPYYLAKKYNVQAEWIDQSKLIDLRKNLYSEDGIIFNYGRHEITAKEALDFLNNIGDPQTLQYCLWIHSVEPLEQLLHERQITSTKTLEISNEIQFSGQLGALQRFIEPFLKDAIIHAGTQVISQRKFDDLQKFEGVWQFFANAKTAEEVKNNWADHFIDFFEEQIIRDELVVESELQFLSGFEVVDFINEWPFESSKREELLKKIKNWEPIFRGRTDEKLVQAILTNLSHVDGLQFQLNFHQPKPDESYAELAIEQIRVKQQTEQKRKNMIGLAVMGFIGVLIIGFLIARNKMLDGDQEIRGERDKYGNVKYYLDDDEDDNVVYTYDDDDDYYEDNDTWWPEEDDEDQAAYSSYEWNEQLAILRNYAKKNERSGSVSSVSEYASLDDMESISNPFIEFFFPLHNKSGAVNHKIENRSDYGVIMLIRSTPDCYSYYIPSNTTYQEPFKFKEGDEVVFYFGKEYVETPDLTFLRGRPAGFKWTDDVTREQLRFSYKITGEYSDWYDDATVLIKRSPAIEFRCNVKIRTYKDGRPY